MIRCEPEDLVNSMCELVPANGAQRANECRCSDSWLQASQPEANNNKNNEISIETTKLQERFCKSLVPFVKNVLSQKTPNLRQM